MRKRYTTLFSFIILVFNFPAFTQFTAEEVTERPQWEEFLKTAKIIDQDQPWGRGEAVTDPWELTLEKDGVVRMALWKNPEGRQKGHIEGWKYEIAAYRLDKYLGLNMVPPTVEKRFREDRGSCQLYAGVMSLLDKEQQNIRVPSYKTFGWNRAIYLHRAFDNLIANEDRHQENFRITEDWRMILIDHSRSFRTSKKFTRQLIYTEKHKEGHKLMKQLPRAFVEKLKSLSFDGINKAVGDYLTDKEIECILIRRNLIMDWLDKRIKDHGEDNVLY